MKNLTTILSLVISLNSFNQSFAAGKPGTPRILRQQYSHNGHLSAQKVSDFRPTDFVGLDGCANLLDDEPSEGPLRLNLRLFSETDRKVAAVVLSLLNMNHPLFDQMIDSAKSKRDLSFALLLTRGFRFFPLPSEALLRPNDPLGLLSLIADTRLESHPSANTEWRKVIQGYQSPHGHLYSFHSMLTQTGDWFKHKDWMWRKYYAWAAGMGNLWFHLSRFSKQTRDDQLVTLDGELPGAMPYIDSVNSKYVRKDFQVYMDKIDSFTAIEINSLAKLGQSLTTFDITDYFANPKWPIFYSAERNPAYDLFRDPEVYQRTLSAYFNDSIMADGLVIKHGRDRVRRIKREDFDSFWSYYESHRERTRQSKNTPVPNGALQLIANVLLIMGPKFYDRAREILEFEGTGSRWLVKTKRTFADLTLEEQKKLVLGDTNLKRVLSSLIHTLYQGGDQNGMLTFADFNGRLPVPTYAISNVKQFDIEVLSESQEILNSMVRWKKSVVRELKKPDASLGTLIQLTHQFDQSANEILKYVDQLGPETEVEIVKELNDKNLSAIELVQRRFKAQKKLLEFSSELQITLDLLKNLIEVGKQLATARLNRKSEVDSRQLTAFLIETQSIAKMTALLHGIQSTLTQRRIDALALAQKVLD